MPSISILSKSEQRVYNQPPKFDYHEKKSYFKLPENLKSKIIEISNPSNLAIFILMFGYFKATNRFYKIDNDDENISFIANEYEFNNITINPKARTIQRYKTIIRTYFSIKDYTVEAREQLVSQATDLANSYIHRKKIFYTLINLCKKLQIEVPSYTELSTIIMQSINFQKSLVINNLKLHLEENSLAELDDFLKKDKEYKNRYNFMSYKKLEHSIARNKMVDSINKFKTIKNKFHLVKSSIDKIGLTSKMASYYSRWAEYSKISQITQKDELNSKFILLSFVYHQYYIRNDNLVDRFIALVQSTKSTIKRVQKERTFEQEPQKRKMYDSLETNHILMIEEIETIIKDNNLEPNHKIISIKKVLQTQNSNLAQIIDTKKELESKGLSRLELIEQKSKSLQGKLSGVLKEIEFDEATSSTDIVEAINYFRKSNGNILINAPIKFLKPEEQVALYKESKIRVSLYKALLFFHVSDSIKSGTLNLKHSYRYKNFDSYLLSLEYWKRNRDMLLSKHNLEHLKDVYSYISNIKLKARE
jgi:hypothetical protein